jgi:predicted AlkP superfamily phosphohydrolase/phosphomutase
MRHHPERRVGGRKREARSSVEALVTASVPRRAILLCRIDSVASRRARFTLPAPSIEEAAMELKRMKSRVWLGIGVAIIALATSAAAFLSNACQSQSPARGAAAGSASAAVPAATASAPADPASGSAVAKDPAPLTPAAAGPRVVLVGFDGGSHDLVARFIAEGRMPWCKKLAESGTFLPLGSANPAESPVAWASINTGMNPGKTNIFGFIRRGFGWRERPGDRPEDPPKPFGFVRPMIGYNRDVDVEMPGASGVKMPSTSNDLRCKNFWDWLDAAGVESRVLQAACNFPATAGEHTRLLAGLSVPDVRGGPGTYLVFTNSEWEFDRTTNNGGEVKKFKIVCPKCKNKSFSLKKGCSKCADGSKVGYFETKLKGPDNFVERQKLDANIKQLDDQFRAEKDPQKKQEVQKQLNTARNQMREWEKENGNATVPLSGLIDRAAKTIKFQLGGKEFTVQEGAWSPYVPITFEVKDAFKVNASAHLHVAQCNEEQDDVRFYLPAITAAADEQPRNMPITSPGAFGKELVGEVGYFDTIGWSCQTHALKDDELPDASFLSAIWDTIQWRRKMLVAQLAQPDWRVLFQVFGETDRVSHMMYRYFDEQHPQFKAADADKTVRFGDRDIKLRDAIPAIYEEVDKTIGLVLERIEKGELGDCTLLVCSDHGFSPFREEVELNAWLIDQGFLVLKKDPSGNGNTTEWSDLGSYADWSKTKAYSVGIGTVYVNLKGREPEGSVDPADYDKVCDEIIAKMRAYRSPNAKSANDPRVFADAWKRSQFLAGPFAADLREDVKLPLSGNTMKGACTEGAADIQVGFNYGYRVAWGTAFGSRSKNGAIVYPNTVKWSGDHTSVHPYLVRGIFFCSRKLTNDAAPHLQDLGPTILALEGVKVPDEMDGHVLPVTGIDGAALAHKGGIANRESLVAPAGVAPPPPPKAGAPPPK